MLPSQCSSLQGRSSSNPWHLVWLAIQRLAERGMSPELLVLLMGYLEPRFVFTRSQSTPYLECRPFYDEAEEMQFSVAYKREFKYKTESAVLVGPSRRAVMLVGPRDALVFQVLSGELQIHRCNPDKILHEACSFSNRLVRYATKMTGLGTLAPKGPPRRVWGYKASTFISGRAAIVAAVGAREYAMTQVDFPDAKNHAMEPFCNQFLKNLTDLEDPN
mmetsp:Transcript_81160/g.216871  ORF Transcript_81160/g.216871 Transcript_81160/m.216871 type:complete len:218 (-) Transcript_81160:255-908(-)